jgi:hypothetical protein
MSAVDSVKDTRECHSAKVFFKVLRNVGERSEAAIPPAKFELAGGYWN